MLSGLMAGTRYRILLYDSWSPQAVFQRQRHQQSYVAVHNIKSSLDTKSVKVWITFAAFSSSLFINAAKSPPSSSRS